MVTGSVPRHRGLQGDAAGAWRGAGKSRPRLGGGWKWWLAPKTSTPGSAIVRAEGPTPRLEWRSDGVDASLPRPLAISRGRLQRTGAFGPSPAARPAADARPRARGSRGAARGDPRR